MTLEHLIIPPILAVFGVGIPFAIFEGEYEAAIVAGLVVVLVKLGDLAVDRLQKKNGGNGASSTYPQCMVHASQVTAALEELKAATKELRTASESLSKLSGKLEVLVNVMHGREI
jgi:hypothetical protein